MPTLRQLALIAALAVVCSAAAGFAQYAEQNVNMVAGTSWPHGDPFLQRQNEPSVAFSTRNPLHLLAGANDYRSVDIPFDTPPSPDNEERGDAWLGVFKSRNGGQTWWSDLLDGYPQQTTSTSPLHGFQAGADPVVRSGPNGMFYYAGLVLNRDTNPLSGVFVARFIDDNRTENGDPFVSLGTQMIDRGTSGAFLDKPWIAVGPGTGTCTANGETFAAQNVYLAYTIFVGGDNNIRTKLMFARSTDCGATWGTPQKLSEGYPINQGATIVVSPTGPVYVVWRLFKSGTTADSIMIAKSIDSGATFTKAAVVKTITPFEQGMTGVSIRTNAYPAAAADANGRLYVAWSDRGYQTNGDGRIVMVHSPDGVNWTGPLVVDNAAPRGHQFMPTIGIAGGRIVVAYYDLRDDSTMGVFTSNHLGGYSESRQAVGDLLTNPALVFSTYLAEYSGEKRRHTLDLRATEMNATTAGPSSAGVARVSRYVFGSRPGKTLIEQLQYNPPNLPLFRLGTAPFIGDSIDITGYAPKQSPVYHVAWTDNRDVRPPLDGNWANYTPVFSPSNTGTSLFSGGTVPQCVPGQTGMRNQNIYTTRVTDGVFAGSPGNTKPLTIQRAFVVFVQNTTGQAKTFKLTATPSSGLASFVQLGTPVPSILVPINPHSTATRTVYVTSSDLHASVNVDVQESDGSGNLISDGLATAVVLNPDVSNPDVSNPDVSNPDVSNPDVSNPDVSNPDVSNSDVHTPDVSNPDVSNPDVSNPDVSNPDVSNPDVSNPDVSNPDVSNPDVSNPDVSNPDVSNPDVSNTSPSDWNDTTWTTHNVGNTTSGYSVKLLSNTTMPSGVQTHLMVYRIYQTPIAKTCALGVEKHTQILANVLNPQFTSSGQLTTQDPNDATFWLAPGDGARITMRVYAPRTVFNAATAVAPAVVAQAANNVNGTISPSPSIAAPPLVITTQSVPDAITGRAYTATFNAVGGVPPYTWTASPPEGATFDGNLMVYNAGFGSSPGTSFIVVTVTDSRGTSVKKQFPVHIYAPLQITTLVLPPATVGQPYSTTLTATGGNTPYVWALYKTPAMPAGLTLNAATGDITGTPTAATSQTINFQVTDSTNPSQFALAQLVFTASSPGPNCGNTLIVLFDNSNTAAVSNNPNGAPGPAFSTGNASYCLDSIWTYHWNNATGATPGTIGLTTNCTTSCTVLGPWQAVGSAGQGGVNNVNWTATPAAPVVLNAGTSYTVSDSSPTTWSENTGSNGFGFTKVYVRSYTPPLTITTASLPNGTAFSPYSATLTAAGGTTPYTWALDPSTPLASGLSFSQPVISGTPQVVGTRPLNVTVTDSSQPPQSVQASFTIAIPGSCALPLAFDTGANASKWFGGDHRAGFAGRNVGTGETITPTQNKTLASVEVPLIWDSSTSDSAPCPSAALPIELDLRDANGTILTSSRSTVPCGTTGTLWVVFNIQYALSAGTPYSFTWWLPNGGTDQVAYDSPGSTNDTIACGTGLAAEVNPGNDLSPWSVWFQHPWDFYIRINTTGP